MESTFSKILFFFLGSLFLASCSKTPDTADPKKSFIKIYNENSFSNAVTAVDVVETKEGYLVLATNQIPDQQFPGVTLLTVDKEGVVIKKNDLPETYVSPAKGLFASGDNYRFLCMNNISTQTYITEVNAKGEFVQATPINQSYPLCFGLAADNSYLVLGYSQSKRASVLSNINTSFAQVWTKDYNILEEVDEPVFAHVSGTGRRLPFAVGQTSSHYFYNGFYNYSFSLVFANPANRNISGVVNGFRYSGGFSTAVPIEGNTFAMSRFYFGDTYFMPRQTLNPSATSVSKDLEGRHMLELAPDAFVSINRYTIGGRKLLFYASNTKNNQIGVYTYDETTGAFIKSRYFGFNVPCEFASMSLTADNGLIITGSAYVNARFKRICLIKLSESELENLVK